MNVFIMSMSTLFSEALQVAIRERRSTWQVHTYTIQTPIFHQTLMKKMKEQSMDLVVIEATNQHVSMIMESLKQLTSAELDIMLLVDSRVGEVYHHLKDEKRWTSVTKNTSLDEFLLLLESFKSHIPDVPASSLKDVDKRILKELAVGHTFEFIQRTQGLTAEDIDQSIYRINTYFKVPNYIESISKAVAQNIIPS